MFNNTDDDYFNATKDAQVNTQHEKSGVKMKVIIFNFLVVSLLAYFLFSYLKTETTLFSGNEIHKKAVLGVSTTVDMDELDDEAFMKVLSLTTEEISILDTNKQQSHEDLSNSMQVLIGETSIRSKSSYTEAISRELDDDSRKGFRGKVVVVKKGDTLSTLATRYYGDANEFYKIIQANAMLSEDSNIIKVGQSIVIP